MLKAVDHANAAQWRLSTGYCEGTPLDRTRTAVTAGLLLTRRGFLLHGAAPPRCGLDSSTAQHLDGVAL
jgi:hypothetical protein